MKITSSCVIGEPKPYSVLLSELTKEEHTAVLTFAKNIQSGNIQIENNLFKQSDDIGVCTSPSSFHDIGTRRSMSHVTKLHDIAEDSNPNINAAILANNEFVKMHPSVKPLTFSDIPLYYGKPTLKHRLFQHIASNGGIMRYTDIIKWVIKEKYQKDISDAEFTNHWRGEWSSSLSIRHGNKNKRGYFRMPGRDGRYLHKRNDGSYELMNPKNVVYL